MRPLHNPKKIVRAGKRDRIFTSSYIIYWPKDQISPRVESPRTFTPVIIYPLMCKALLGKYFNEDRIVTLRYPFDSADI